MHFDKVPKLPAHHLHGATLQDGARLWAVAAFGGEVSLSSTVGGVHVAHVMPPQVAMAVAQEIGLALHALGEQQQQPED